MAKPNSEAKIKFTAETGQFNKAIGKAEDELKVLRAELKLNETQMKNTGESVEGLEREHKLLTEQLKNAQDKTEALRGKLDKAIEIYGEGSTVVANYKRSVANARIEEEKITKKIADCADKLKEQRSAANQSGNAIESLTDKIDRQERELKDLKGEYIEAVTQYGKNSREAKDLAREIKKLSGELKDNQKAYDDASAKADKLDKSMQGAGDASSGAAGGFTVAKGAIAELAADAIQMAIGKVSEFIGWLKELPEVTRELRQDMATLETSYSRAGFTVEQAKSTWQELYAIFGEDDRAVEAANLIAKMSSNQEDLNTWVTITKGIWGTYQDSLPVEGLAEASNETAKVGQVTGVLADALNWSSEAASMFAKYMGGDVKTAEDAFNVALSECSTEAERQALITETLTALYGGAATEYDKASGSLTDAKNAIAENTLVQNEMAEAIEPVTTAWQELKTDALEAVLPVIQAVCNFIGENTIVLKVLTGALAAITYVIAALAVVLAAAFLIAFPMVGVLSAVAVAIFTMVLYWEEFVAWLDANVIQPIKNFFVNLWNGIQTVASSLWESVKSAWSAFTTWISTNIIQPVVNFFVGLWASIQSVWTNICNVVQVAIMLIGSIISAAFQIITLPFRFIWENCKDTVMTVWNAIKSGISTAINAIKNVITTVFNAVKNFFSTVWNGIKNVVVTVWNAIKTAITTVVNAIKTRVTTVFNAVKNTVSSIFNGIKSVATSVWNTIKNAVTTAVNAVKTRVTSVFNSVRSTVSGVFNSIKSTATSVWNGIKNAIITPIEAAKNKIKGIIDTIKGFFSNLKLKLPNIKLPHFSISGSFSLSPPSVPKLKIDWYKDGGIMTKPTIFGMNGNSLMAGGEAGAEAILPISKLEDYIVGAIEKTVNVVNFESLAAAVEDLANRPIKMNINGREFAYATASDTDSVGGMRNSFVHRGLIVE